ERPCDLFTFDSFWPETREKWVKQGAPKEILPAYGERRTSRFLRDYFQFGFDYFRSVQTGVGSHIDHEPSGLGYGIEYRQITPIVPNYEPRIISEDERTITYISGDGQTMRSLKDAAFRMPTYLDWPVKDRASWNEYKKRLDPNTPERWPADWNAHVQETNKLGEEIPISLDVGSFYGYLREWVGSEKILYMFYDNPNLIEDMMEQILYLETEVIKRVVKDIRVDLATFWEDMAYKG
ncbi:unnamed protein product, partial [marine sediment metagenome]